MNHVCVHIPGQIRDFDVPGILIHAALQWSGIERQERSR